MSIIKQVEGKWCSSCGEVELDAGLEDSEADRVSREMGAFIKQVNAQLSDAEFIHMVRKNLGLKQKEAAKLFGGGHNGFSRYETGRTVPPVALLLLFKLLDKHPELINEIREKEAAGKAATTIKEGRPKLL